MHRRTRNALTCLAMALALLTLAASPALAVTQAEVDAAQQTVNGLFEKSLAAQQELDQTRSWLEQTNGKLDEISAELDESTEQHRQAQQNLSRYISSTYKLGPVGILHIVLDSASFEEFTGNLYYASKISQGGVEAIAEVNRTKAWLEGEQESLKQAQADQNELLERQQAESAQLDERLADQQSYLDGLSAELRAQIDLERAQAEAQAALEEERQQEGERQPGGDTSADGQDQQDEQDGQDASQGESGDEGRETPEEPAQQQEEEPAPEPEHEPEPEPEPEPAPTTKPSKGSSAGQRIVDLAMTQLGVPYSYAATSWGSLLDCSGLTYLAYQKAGYDIPRCQNYRNGGQNSQAYVVHSRDWKTSVSDLEIGDIVFYGAAWNCSEHVGIYCGNGNNVEATAQGVMVQPVYNPNWHPTWHNFLGGGSPL